MDGAVPLDDVLPGERQLASLRDGRLRLTDQRVVFHGRGLRRHDSLSLRLADITAVGIASRLALSPLFFVVPLLLWGGGLAITLLRQDMGEALFIGSMAAAVTLPLAFVIPHRAIRVVVPGRTLHVRLRQAEVAAAKEFVWRVEAARSGVLNRGEDEADRPRATAFVPGR